MNKKQAIQSKAMCSLFKTDQYVLQKDLLSNSQASLNPKLFNSKSSKILSFFYSFSSFFSFLLNLFPIISGFFGFVLFASYSSDSSFLSLFVEDLTNSFVVLIGFTDFV